MPDQDHVTENDGELAQSRTAREIPDRSATSSTTSSTTDALTDPPSEPAHSDTSLEGSRKSSTASKTGSIPSWRHQELMDGSTYCSSPTEGLDSSIHPELPKAKSDTAGTIWFHPSPNSMEIARTSSNTSTQIPSSPTPTMTQSRIGVLPSIHTESGLAGSRRESNGVGAPIDVGAPPCPHGAQCVHCDHLNKIDPGNTGAARRPTPPSVSSCSRRNHTSSLSPSGKEDMPSTSTGNPMITPDTSKRRENRRRNVLQDFKLLLQPARPHGDPPNVSCSLYAIARSSPLNALLVFIPIGWALHFANVNQVAVFVCNFLAIVPLASLLCFATEELADRVGKTLGGLLNATLGNAVELIVAVIALAQCKLTVVQSSLIGSILSNLLLVLGMCFFAGGIKYSEQSFLSMPSQLNSSLLVISVIAVLLPAAFHAAIITSNNSDDDTSDDVPGTVQGTDILKMGRGVAMILLVIYASYLAFTLWSHAEVMNAEPTVVSTRYSNKKRPAAEDTSEESENDETKTGMVQPKMNIPVTIGLLIGVTVLVGVTSEFLVSSIDGVTASGVVSEEWVGLILLPIVGNAAEHVTAVTVSVRDKLDLSIAVAVGSSIQIALFVIPSIVVLAWMMGKPLTMLFDPFQSVVLFLAVLTVNYVVQDGKSNWLEGMILMNLYVIIALCFWFYPGVDPTLGLGLTC